MIHPSHYVTGSHHTIVPMCGRFTLSTNPRTIAAHFNRPEVPSADLFSERYNIAPTQTVPAVRADESKRRSLAMLRWGLIPSWAKDPKIWLFHHQRAR